MYGHINSAFCDGVATTVTAAHNFIWRYLYASMHIFSTIFKGLYVWMGGYNCVSIACLLLYNLAMFI